jgi:HlyD family secretion protein
MSGRKFFMFLGVVFLIALAIYFFTTPKGTEIALIGVVDGNEVIVSPQISGRIVKLTVDEGSEVKKGQLIAELDPSELQAQLAAQEANISNLEAQVGAVRETWGWTNDQTEAGVKQAEAMVTAAKSQLDQARATLWLDEVNYKRSQSLFEGGISSAQDRDAAEAALKAQQAQVKNLEDQVKAQQAQLEVARANRKQLNVQQSQLAAMKAQLQQARANKDVTQTQFGYTHVYAPIDGIVSVRVAKQGEVVAQGGPIVVVVDVDHLWVRAEVEETYIDSIHFGDRLRVRLPSGDALDGTVFFKGVESDFATQRDVSRTKRDIKTFAIKVAVPNPKRQLFTGMTATVLLPPPAEKKHWYGRS